MVVAKEVVAVAAVVRVAVGEEMEERMALEVAAVGAGAGCLVVGREVGA